MNGPVSYAMLFCQIELLISNSIIDKQQYDKERVFHYNL